MVCDVMPGRKVLTLSEYETESVSPEVIPEEVGRKLWQEYAGKIDVESPSFRTEGQWQLTSQGWVGYIPLSDELGIALQPRVKLENLFRMLEYAYNLKSFKFLPGLFNSQSLEELYESLASVLARRVLDRGRKGLYRQYLDFEERLPYITGRLDVSSMVREPWKVQPKCYYQEHTADVEENQILAWTLRVVARSGICTERVMPLIRRAYHLLESAVSVRSFKAQSCIGRLYNRLNDDYEPLHALCRFFLEHSGPTHKLGGHTMIPFMVDMPVLYERFVAEWMLAHLPSEVKLRTQEKIDIDREGKIKFEADLVLYDAENDKTLCVLDTKYKIPSTPSTADIAQVVAYAEAKGCSHAFLVYPVPLPNALNAFVGSIKVHNLTFSLDGDVDQQGQTLLSELSKFIHSVERINN